MVKLPELGINLIKEFEGFEGKAYPDPRTGGDPWTIGYGTTVYVSGDKVRRGETISESEADKELKASCEARYYSKLKAIPYFDEMTESQQGALMSFAFNLGADFYGGRNFNTITKVLKNKEWDKMRETLLLYVNPGSNVEKGLRRRRSAEADLWFSKAAGNAGVSEAGDRPSQVGAIICKADTYLKKSTKQASELPASEKSLQTEGKRWQVVSREDAENGHTKVVLDYGAGTWYIFDNHWDCSWGGRNDEAEDLGNISAALKRQLERSCQYNGGNILNLKTKATYYSQRDNRRQWRRTCNSSSNAMYTNWLLRACGKPGLNGDNDFLNKVLSIGDSIYHGIQTQVVRQYGFKTKWMTDRDLPFVKELLSKGFVVPCNIKHLGSDSRPHGGHVLALIGYKDGVFTAHDPWGTLESRYSNHNGAYSKISESTFKKRWQGGYRILA